MSVLLSHFLQFLIVLLYAFRLFQTAYVENAVVTILKLAVDSLGMLVEGFFSLNYRLNGLFLQSFVLLPMIPVLETGAHYSALAILGNLNAFERIFAQGNYAWMKMFLFVLFVFGPLSV